MLLIPEGAQMALKTREFVMLAFILALIYGTELKPW